MTKQKNEPETVTTEVEVDEFTEAPETESNEVSEAVRTAETFSPYKATDFVNNYLAEVGLTDKDGNPKRLPAQMLYRYVQDSRIKAAKVDGKWAIKAEDLAEWLLAYTDKQLALQKKRDEADAEAA